MYLPPLMAVLLLNGGISLKGCREHEFKNYFILFNPKFEGDNAAF